MAPSPRSQARSVRASVRPTSKKFPSHPRLKALLTEASLIDGHNPTTLDPSEIPWIDYSLLEAGRSFVVKNYAAIIFLIAAADTAGFVTKQIASTVFKNFWPENVCGARFLSTFRTTMSGWLLSGFQSEKGSLFLKEIARVRKMHQIYANPKVKPIIPPPGLEYPKEYQEILGALRQDLARIDTSNYPSDLFQWEPKRYFTQMDIALVQVGMFSPLMINPRTFGVQTDFDTDKGMQGYFHMWAVIGRMLGLEDRFNLGLNPDKELYQEIVFGLGIPALKMADESVIFSMERMVEGVWRNAVSVKTLLYGVLSEYGIEANALWKTMGWKDKIGALGTGVFVWGMRWWVVRAVANWGVRRVLESEKKR